MNIKKGFFSVALLCSFSVSFPASPPDFMIVVGEQIKTVAQDEPVKSAAADVRIAIMKLAQVSFKKYAQLASPQEKQILLRLVALLQDVLEDGTPIFRGGSLVALNKEQREALGQKIMVLQQMAQVAGMKLAEYMQENYSKVSMIKKGSKTVQMIEPDLNKLAPFFMPVLEGVQLMLKEVEQELIT